MLHIPDGAAQERAKYAEIWALEDYGRYSPGLENVDRFMTVVKPPVADSIGVRPYLLDIGCGQGVAGLEFARRGLSVWYLDITAAGLKPEVDRTRFIETPLWAQWPDPVAWFPGMPVRWDYGFCCDVMEHIPPEYTMAVIDRILSRCGTTYFQICNLPDEFGKRIGEPLHLTVQPFKWWLIRLATLGAVIDARDLCGASLFVVKR